MNLVLAPPSSQASLQLGLFSSAHKSRSSNRKKSLLYVDYSPPCYLVITNIADWGPGKGNKISARGLVLIW